MFNAKQRPTQSFLRIESVCLGMLTLLVLMLFHDIPCSEAVTPICTNGSTLCAFLNQKQDEGLAAGNAGDSYQNADGGHSPLTNVATDHPQVTILPRLSSDTYNALTYTVVVGNASLAYRSLPGEVSLTRMDFMGGQYGANAAYQQYCKNNAYWYPEHYDHDAIDDYHGMLPSVNNSQGSSYSDIDEVKKYLWTLAAFRPDTKTKLKESGLLMPTLEMIMRRTRVASDAEYLSGKAHINAYDDYDNGLAMAQLANAMLTTDIPPMIQLTVTGDTYDGVKGRDYFDANSIQRVYDTPVSIARIWRNFNYTQCLTVTAEASYDLNNRPLTFHWVVLRGDPARVRITPLNAANSKVEVEIDHHPETTILDTTRKTNLVIVGAFVHNGAYYSAPGFVTSYTLPNEQRTYEAATHKIKEITYQARALMESLICNKAWSRDVFQYDAGGTLLGWTRYTGTAASEFTPEGYRVLAKDLDGRVTQAQQVSYSRNYIDGMDTIGWAATGTAFTYINGTPVPSTATPTFTATPHFSATATPVVSNTPRMTATRTPVAAATPQPSRTLTCTVSPTRPISVNSVNLDQVRVYPRPWRADAHSGTRITFDHLTPGSTLMIFTLSGDLIKTLRSDGNSIAWDISNASGRPVSHGIYFYLIKNSQGQKTRGKLAIIR